MFLLVDLERSCADVTLSSNFLKAVEMLCRLWLEVLISSSLVWFIILLCMERNGRSWLSLAVVTTYCVFYDLPTRVQVVLLARSALFGHFQHCVDELIGLSGLVQFDESLLVTPAAHQLQKPRQVFLSLVDLFELAKAYLRRNYLSILNIFLQNLPFPVRIRSIGPALLVSPVLLLQLYVDLILRTIGAGCRLHLHSNQNGYLQNKSILMKSRPINRDF